MRFFINLYRRLYRYFTGSGFRPVHVFSAGAFLLTLLNLILKFNGPFVISYLEYIGLDDDVVYSVLVWSALVITRLFFVGGSIYIVLSICRWIQGRLMINWVRVGLFFINYNGLILSFGSLVLSLLGVCFNVDVSRVQWPEPASTAVDGGSTSDVCIVVDSPVSNLSLGYSRVRDAIYYDSLTKEEPVIWIDEPAIVIDLRPMEVAIATDLQSGPDFTVISKEVPSSPAEAAVGVDLETGPDFTLMPKEDPSTPVGSITYSEFIDAHGEFWWRHQPGTEYLGKSEGFSIDQYERLAKRLRPEKPWLRALKDRKVWDKMMADGCRLASDNKVVARLRRRP